MSIVKLPPTDASPVRPNGHTNEHTHGHANGTNLARVAVGLAVLAGERLSAPPATPTPTATPPSTAQRAVAISVGLVHGASARVAHTLVALADHSHRIAVDGAHLVSTLPAPRAVRVPLEKATARVAHIVADAEDSGRATMRAGREDAVAFLQSSIDDGIDWAELRVVPRIVDDLVPHLIDEVLPRVIDGAMPAIREQVLPTIIDDLASDPRIRDMVVEQSRGVLGEAAENIREGTASADDRVESIARRLLHRAPTEDE